MIEPEHNRHFIYRPFRRPAIWLGWLVPVCVLVLLAIHLGKTPVPDGQDSLYHLENALGLHFILQHEPAEAIPFLRTMELHYPPLRYFVSALWQFLLPSVWSFHVTTWLAAALFLLFYGLALRRATGRNDLALLGLLVLCANPQWVNVAVANNLEMTLNAAVAFVLWVVVSERYTKSILSAIGWGLLCGVAFLAKTVIVVHFLLPFLVIFGLGLARSRVEKGSFWPVFAFLASLFCVVFAWFGPLLWKFPAEIQVDLVVAQQWWFYLRQFFFGYAALPLLLAFFLVAWRVRWRETNFSMFLPVLGAVGAVIFFHLIGTKRPWYLLGAYALLVVFFLHVFSLSKAKATIWLARGLLVIYGLLAVLNWLPGTVKSRQVLALGSSGPTEAFAIRPTEFHRQLGDRLMQLIQGRELEGLVVLDFMNKVDMTTAEKWMGLRHPAMSFVRGKGLPAWLQMERLDRSQFVLAVEKPAVRGPSASALYVAGPDTLSEGERRRLTSQLDGLRNNYREVYRQPLEDVTLALYEKANHSAIYERETSPIDYIQYYYLNDPYRHAGYLKRTAALCRRGRAEEALRRYRMFLRYDSLHARAYEMTAVCLQRLPPEQAFDELARTLETGSPPATAIRIFFDRAFSLEISGQVQNRFEPLAVRLMEGLAVDDPNLAVVTGKLLDFYLIKGKYDSARAVMEKKLTGLPEKAALSAWWDYAELARERGANDLAADLYEMCRRHPKSKPTQRNLAAIRLALLGRAVPGQAIRFELISDPEQAQAATELLLMQSSGLREKQKAEDALAVLVQASSWSADYPHCREQIWLEQARCHMMLGDREQAQALLEQIEEDKELREIARNLLQSL